jgi:hypothetical protein
MIRLRDTFTTVTLILLAPGLGAQATGQLPKVKGTSNGVVQQVTYGGRPALKLVATPEMERVDTFMLAFLDEPEFRNGTITLDVAGAPRADAGPTARGFIGIAFRSAEQGEWAEIVYLRPTNARANDQLRRNRSVQYVSHPEFPWQRLRAEQNGMYESYVDLEPGAWTRMRVEVSGSTAQLFVGDAPQPVLVINDLKRGDVSGRIALWAQVSTDAYFGPIQVTRR